MRTFILLSVAGVLSVAAQGQNANDKEEVRKVITAFEEDFNNGFKDGNSYTTTDWEHINPGGGIDKGRNNVLKTVRAVHQTFLKGVTLKTESIDIRFITPDVAIADAIDLVDTYITPDGVKHENERHIKTYVVVKKNGKWLLAQDHATTIQR